MIALTSPYLWYTTRATGYVTLVLFTVVVALGSLVANRVGGTVVGRFEVNELHRSASLVAMAFLAVHVASTALDSFVPTGWLSVVLPGASHYRTLAVALGAVAFDLTLAVWISSLLKTRIRPTSWRFIHWFSWLAFASAVVHAYLTGTDARRGLGLVGVGLCAALGAAAGLWRFLGRPTRAGGRTALSPLAPAPRATRLGAQRPPKDPRTGSARRPFDVTRAEPPHAPPARRDPGATHGPPGRPGAPSTTGPFPRAPRATKRKGR